MNTIISAISGVTTSVLSLIGIGKQTKAATEIQRSADRAQVATTSTATTGIVMVLIIIALIAVVTKN